MRLPFLSSAAPKQKLRMPAPSKIPEMGNVEVAAHYRAARVGGDFYDFIEIGERLLFLMIDIAGEREQAFHIAAALQDRLHTHGKQLFTPHDINLADKLTDLLLDLNRTIMQTAGGVRCAPAFLGCLESVLGTLCYVNAGHTPAIVKDGSGIFTLEAGGFPLGLFSHATHDSQMTFLMPESAIVLVSKGLLEVRSGLQEFGLERAKEVVIETPAATADDLCFGLLEGVKKFQESQNSLLDSAVNLTAKFTSPEKNDVTAVAIKRK